MKHILEFDSIEDHDTLMRCIHSEDMCSFIWDFEAYLRSTRKHTDFNTDEEYKLIEGIEDKWHEMKYANDINLDKLWS